MEKINAFVKNHILHHKNFISAQQILLFIPWYSIIRENKQLRYLLYLLQPEEKKFLVFFLSQSLAKVHKSWTEKAQTRFGIIRSLLRLQKIEVERSSTYLLAPAWILKLWRRKKKAWPGGNLESVVGLGVYKWQKVQKAICKAYRFFPLGRYNPIFQERT